MKRALVLLMACFASIVMSAQQLHWTPVDEGLYSGSTGIIAVVQIDGVEQTSTQIELAAFCGEECRGTAFTSEFPITHRFLAMLNVYGENGHELTFKAYDHATNQELLDMNPVVTVVFSEDGSGSLFEPLELNFINEVVVENITFADANVKALCVANWDTNGDGELSYAEAAAVTDLGTVFRGNSNITSFDELQFFTGLTAINNYSFKDCLELITVTIPNTVTSIRHMAFCSCRKLASFTIPNTVTSIGSLAFEDVCLTSISIPASVTSIGEEAFGSCSSLAQIVVEPNNTVYDSRDNCNAIIKTSDNKLISGCKNTIIPNTVTSIGNFAFYGCDSLTSITIPSLVDSVGKGVFGRCSSLTQISVVPDNTVYDSRDNCNAIIKTSNNILISGCKNTIIPNSVITIGTYAFYNCDGLTSITIPASVTSIKTGAFLSCSNLASMSILSLAPPTIEDGAFTNVNKAIPVSIPCGSLSVYQNASGWSEFTNYQELECPSYEITATANPSNGGMIAGGGTYTQGATCTLTATPVTGYSFVNWTENNEIVFTDATYSFEVTEARSLVANFMAQGPITNHWTPNQTFENTMDGIGIVLIDGVEQQSAALELGIFCGEDCRGSILPEREDDHWFYYFSMGGVTGDTFTFRLYDHASQQELELTCFNEVQFVINGFLGDWDEPYEIQFSNNLPVTATVNPEGAGEVIGAGEYPHGTTATLSATANAGFAFRDWSINGETISTEPTLTLTVETPIQVTANFNYVQEYSFSTGWNWWSSYIELSDIEGLTMLEEGLGESGVMIKTNGSYARRRANNTWFGSLNSINNETGYKVQTSSACTMVMTGSLANPADHPITINANGWTWIGYPVQTSQSANAALSGFNPEDRDMVKGQNGYARYDANSGTWKPSSFTLMPGKAYLYYSNATEGKSLIWNAGRATATNPEHHWIPNQTFENTMDGIGIVIIDGEEQFAGNLELGIFCGDDCRGSVFAEDEGDHWFYYFSMGGVNGETFTFRLFDHATQEELDLTCNNEAVPFEINGFLGDWDAPYEIAFTSNSTQTFTLPITGYGNSAGGYRLIAPPFDDIDPAEIEGMTSGDYDLYYFDQSQAGEEWRNYEASPFNLESGKGYLYAHKTDITLTFTGTPYNGNGQVTLTKTEGVPFAGWNLVGNPYAQTATIGDRPFYVMREDGGEIIVAQTANIDPMQGIFVIAAANGETLTFSTSNGASQSSRIVLSLLHGRNVPIDRAIIRFNEDGSLPKMMLHPNSTKLYIPDGGKDYAVVSAGRDGVHTVSTEVGFKATENGTYTLSVDIENLDLDYLHLFDNKTGADVDLLMMPSYTFEASTADQAERFRLVYATATGMEEGFAYITGSENLIVNGIEGEATLQVVDVLGHVLSSERFSGSYEKKLNVAPGVYMLRLISGDDIKVQKMVVK